MDAALPTVLQSCKILYDGVSSMDHFLKKVFARVGFLQAHLWKKYPEETQEFFLENPELALFIMKEMVERRDQEPFYEHLPAMERPSPPPMPMPGTGRRGRPHVHPRPRRQIDEHSLADD